MNACVAQGPGRGGALPRWHRGCDVANEKKTSKYFHRRHRNEKRGGGEEKACLLQPAFNHFYRRVARAPTRARQHKEKEEEAA